MGHVAVVGAGAMGLAAAYHAAKAEHSVEVLEAGPEPGKRAAALAAALAKTIRRSILDIPLLR